MASVLQEARHTQYFLAMVLWEYYSQECMVIVIQEALLSNGTAYSAPRSATLAAPQS